MNDHERCLQQAREEAMAAFAAHFRREKERKLDNYRQQNAYALKGQVLFTGSSLMENFPITEYCMSDGGPIAYNRGIGGYTTDEFLAAADTVLLDLQPSKLFMNIGTNDIREMPEGEDWFEHLSANLRTICALIHEKLPDCEVFLMAFYPVNPDAPLAGGNPGLKVRTNENIEKANRMLESLAAGFGFRYIDVNDGLRDGKGCLKAEHTQDGMHFDSEAYRTVYARLRAYL